MNYITIQEAVNQFKELIERSIVDGGESKKTSAIRSQKPINIIHDAVKAEFIRHRVKPECISPLYGHSDPELSLSGFFKSKDQDICIKPLNIPEQEEILNFDGILKGKRDPYGFDLTEKILSVNVRSQLSSISKNFDTLYERNIAEPLNLHLRCPKMVLGEFYVIPVYSYDDSLFKTNEVGWIKNRNTALHIQKYIYSFTAINNRITTEGEHYKYERVCLLIVDFSQDEPKIYNTNDELKADGLLPEHSTALLDEMNFNTFATTLLDIHTQRFGNSMFS